MVSTPPSAPAPPCTIVIFGAGGDLTKRLLIPALHNLAHARLLDDRSRILGVDHGQSDDQGFRKELGDFLRALSSGEPGTVPVAFDADAWGWLEPRISYLQGDFEAAETYQRVGAKLGEAGGHGGGCALFYLATAPRFFGEVADQLGRAGLTKPPHGGFRRLVVEKPFGVDLASAKALNRRLLKSLSESQIYRIDHFLGKETVRNIMVTRFGNGVFEPLWSRLHIDHVQITAAETVGVETRGGYYDTVGALRDMIPSHMLQLLALTAMEPPNNLGPEAIRAESGRLLEAIARQAAGEALSASVRGQYRAGRAGGRDLTSYRQSPGVSADSRTETYAAIRLTIDNWRWAGVPFYLRTGKALCARDTEIAIQFKGAPQALFGPEAASPNVLVLHIQPHEGISLQFEAKQPGPDVRIASVAMDFRYADYFRTEPTTGYETLLYDCLIGDKTLFKGADEVEFAWAAVTPFLDAWRDQGAVDDYVAGSDGPAAAGALMAADGRSWRPIGG
jgi:glucose-6-phosphate 1-dehydrogenase